MRVKLLVVALVCAGCGRTGSIGGDPWIDTPPYLDVDTDARWDPRPDTRPDIPPDGVDVPTDGTEIDVPWDVEPPAGTCPPGWRCRNHDLPLFSGVDILVVVDNSMSMIEEQINMAEQFPILIQNLLDPEISPATGRPEHVPVTDVHIGIVSTDMGTGGYLIETCSDPMLGDDGVLQHEPSSAVPGCDPTYFKYLVYDVASPDPDAVDWMSTGFACLGMLGIDGCGFEQQMEAGLKALDVHSRPGGQNYGFLRSDTVLMVVWLTDEEDCSVLDPFIFDPLASELGHLNLRCFNHPDMVQRVERYVDGFRALRSGSMWPVVLGMIVGVPLDEKECNGFGHEIGNCLSVPEMIQRIDPVSMTRLVPSCVTENGEAYPPRRFVELAQAFGSAAYVHSICGGDYEPALTALSQLVNSVADLTCEAAIVNLEKSTGDPCLCTSDCDVVHVLTSDGPCPSGTSEWDHDGDTIPNDVRDDEGRRVSACEVQNHGTRIGSCTRECHDPYQTYSAADVGWYYSLSYTGVACPTVSFTVGSEPPAGATTFVACPP